MNLVTQEIKDQLRSRLSEYGDCVNGPAIHKTKNGTPYKTVFTKIPLRAFNLLSEEAKCDTVVEVLFGLCETLITRVNYNDDSLGIRSFGKGITNIIFRTLYAESCEKQGAVSFFVRLAVESVIDPDFTPKMADAI